MVCLLIAKSVVDTYIRVDIASRPLLAPRLGCSGSVRFGWDLTFLPQDGSISVITFAVVRGILVGLYSGANWNEGSVCPHSEA
jgi:hypothetical protein